MKKPLSIYRQAGFTLIELMVVVGIIGILVAIAAPNFQRYQSKARQTEAKLALAAIYAAEKSFYSEFAAYAGSMDAIGYAPEGARRFYDAGFADVHSGTITGYGGVLTTGNYTAAGNGLAGCGTAPALGTQLSDDAQSFVAASTGCISQGAGSFDTWNIDDGKIISNNVVAL